MVATDTLANDVSHSSGLPMARIEHNAQLNQIIVDLGQSLLQFVGEVSPWTPASATAARETLAQCVDQQKQHVDHMVQLLVNRGQTTDFGVYPADYTDLHFLALKALLPRIITNQDAMLVELDEAVHTCVDDPEALDVLNSVLAGERQITAALKAVKL